MPYDYIVLRIWHWANNPVKSSNLPNVDGSDSYHLFFYSLHTYLREGDWLFVAVFRDGNMSVVSITANVLALDTKLAAHGNDVIAILND